MSPESPKINFYFIGTDAGFGESIIVNVSPNNLWGLIDCYSSSYDPDSNPVLEILKKYEVKELEFLCWTHPHYDHSKGLSHILKKYKNNIKSIWKFSPFTNPKDLYRYAKSSFKSKHDNNYDILETYELLTEYRKKKGEIIHFERIEDLYVDKSINLNIFGLGPSPNTLEEIQDSFKDHINIISYGENSMLTSIEVEEPNINSVCGAILINFGDTIIILGADVENENWDYIFKENNKKHKFTLSPNLLKISHHGSKNANSKETLDEFTKSRIPIGIIFPYKSQNLPDKETISLFKKYSMALKSTSKKNIKHNYPDYFNIDLQTILNKELNHFSKRLNSSYGIIKIVCDDKGNLVDFECDGISGKLQ